MTDLAPPPQPAVMAHYPRWVRFAAKLTLADAAQDAVQAALLYVLERGLELDDVRVPSYVGTRIRYEAGRQRRESQRARRLEREISPWLDRNDQQVWEAAELMVPFSGAVRRGRENALKTQCPRGHQYDDVNTSIRANGSRRCRQCAREMSRRARAARSHGETARRGRVYGRKTHCLRGHPFDEENAYRRPNGSRGCRQCARLRKQAWLANTTVGSGPAPHAGRVRE